MITRHACESYMNQHKHPVGSTIAYYPIPSAKAGTGFRLWASFRIHLPLASPTTTLTTVSSITATSKLKHILKPDKLSNPFSKWRMFNGQFGRW